MQDNVPKGLLSSAASRLVERFKAADSDEERKKWGAEGPEIARLDEFLEKMPDIYSAVRVAADDYQEISRMGQEHPAEGNIDERPLGRMALAVLRPSLIEDPQEFDSLQKDLATVVPFADDFLR